MKNYKLLLAVFLSFASVAYAAEPYTFTSKQTGSSAANGRILQTNGSISTWVATTTLGISPVGGSLTKGNFLVGDDSGTAQATSSIFISSAGLIGIGTTTPIRQLSIANSGANNQILLEDKSQAPGLRDATLGYVNGEFRINRLDASYSSTSLMKIDSSGRMGVGTTSPYAPLSVNGKIAGTVLSIDGAVQSRFADGVSIGGTLTLPSLSAGFAAINSSGALYTTASSSMGLPASAMSLAKGNFLVGDDLGVAQATSSVYISSIGKVGIGTTTPGTVLNVAVATGAGATEVARLTAHGNTAALRGPMLTFWGPIGTGVSRYVAGISGMIGAGQVGGDTVFYNPLANESLGPETMRIDGSSSFVGIGTSTPTAMLSINGKSAQTAPLFSVASSSASATSTVFRIGSTGQTLIGGDGVGSHTGAANTPLVIRQPAVVETPGLGATTVGDSGWASTSPSWTGTLSTGFTHDGSAGTQYLINSGTAITANVTYQISFDIVGRTTGGVSLIFGNATSTTAYSTDASYKIGMRSTTAGGSVGFMTNNSFNGTIQNYKIQLTSYSGSAMTILDSAGLEIMSMRGSPQTLGSLFIGRNTGQISYANGSNTAFGNNIMQYCLSCFNNTAVGANAMQAITTGYFSSAYGMQALQAQSAGIQNDAFGYQTLKNLTTASGNAFFGNQSGMNVTTGSNNVSVGQANLTVITTETNNTAIGTNALSQNKASSNSALGALAGYSNITGGGDVFIGDSAGRYNQSATSSVYVGYYAGRGNANYSSQFDTAVGNNSLAQITTGSAGNTALGYKTGYAVTTGQNNIFIGNQTGDALTTGSGNIIIGNQNDMPAVDSSNMLNIGNLLYGTTLDGTGTTLSSGNIGIGTSTPSTKLQVRNTSNSALLIEETDSSGTAFNNSNAFMIRNTNNAVNNWNEIGFYDAANTVTSGIANQTVSQASNYGDLTFFTRGSGGFGERMRILGSGNVGIGTTTPGSKLQIADNDLTRTQGTVLTISDMGATTDAKNWSFQNLDGAFKLLAVNDLGTGAFPVITALRDNSVHVGTTSPTGLFSAFSVDEIPGWPSPHYLATVANTSKTVFSVKNTGEINLNGATTFPIINLGANYSVTDNDWTMNATTSSFNITLPDATSRTGRVYNVKNSGSGSVNVICTSSQTVDGYATTTLTTKQAITVQSDGANWIIY